MRAKIEDTKRKNFLPTLIIIFGLWILFLLILFFVDPKTIGHIILFLLVLYLALFFTLSLLFAKTKRGFIISTSVLIFLILSYIGLGNLLNLALIVGISIALDAR